MISGGFDSTGVFTVNLEFDLADAERAAAAAEPVRIALERTLEGSLFRVSDVDAAGDRLHVTVLTDPLVDKLDSIDIQRR